MLQAMTATPAYTRGTTQQAPPEQQTGAHQWGVPYAATRRHYCLRRQIESNKQCQTNKQSQTNKAIQTNNVK